MKIEKRKMISVYLDARQEQALRKLSEKTRVTMAVFIREGIDLLLRKYKVKGK